jgi:hypothetical protein
MAAWTAEVRTDAGAAHADADMRAAVVAQLTSKQGGSKKGVLTRNAVVDAGAAAVTAEASAEHVESALTSAARVLEPKPEPPGPRVFASAGFQLSNYLITRGAPRVLGHRHLHPPEGYRGVPPRPSPSISPSFSMRCVCVTVFLCVCVRMPRQCRLVSPWRRGAAQAAAADDSQWHDYTGSDSG